MRRLLLFLLLAVASGLAAVPIQVNVFGTTNAANSCKFNPGSPGSGNLTCVLPSNVSAGNVLVVSVGSRVGTATGVTSITDNLIGSGTAYTLLASSPNVATVVNGTWLYARTIGTGGALTVTVQLNGTYFFGYITIAEYDGTVLTETSAGSTQNSASASVGVATTPSTCGAFTPSQANTQVVAAFFRNDAATGTMTPSSPMTSRIFKQDGTVRKILFQDYFMGAAVSINPSVTDTDNSSTAWSCAAAALASASGTPTLSSIAPSTGMIGTSVPVTLTGTNLTGATSISAGSGITVSSLVVVNSTTVTASFAISAGAGAGAQSVTITTPSGTSGTVTFTITSTPTLVQAGPSTCKLSPAGAPGTGDLTCAFTSNVTSGNRAFVGISFNRNTGSATGVTSITDTLGTSFTSISSSVDATTGAFLYAGTIAGTAGTTHADTVTVTLNGTYFFGWLSLAEYRASDLTITSAGTSGHSDASNVNTHTCGAITPTKTNVQFVTVFYGNDSNNTPLVADSPIALIVEGHDGATTRQMMMAGYFMTTAVSLDASVHDNTAAERGSCAAAAFESALSATPSARRRQVIQGSGERGRAAAPAAADWSIVVFSDQHPTSGGAPWIANSTYAISNEATWNTQAYLFSGDVLANGDTLANFASQGWDTVIARGFPTIASAGNHDCNLEDCSARATSLFDTHLGYQKFSGKSYGPVTAFSGIGNDVGLYNDTAFGSQANYAIRFAVNGHKFLVIALELFPRTAVMTWAGNLAAYYVADHKVIYLAHADVEDRFGVPCTISTVYCAGSGGGYNAWTTTGALLHSTLIAPQANSFLSFSGHFPDWTPHYARYPSTGTNGNSIFSFFYDYQACGTVTPACGSNNNNAVMQVLFHENTATFDVIIHNSSDDSVYTSWTGMPWAQ